MKPYSLTHLADHTLLQALVSLVTQDHVTTAALLAHLAEVDERKLYLPAAHASMYSYCLQELHMSEDTAFKRLRVARTARQFPAVFAALADGRLNLSAVLLLRPHLDVATADALVAAAAHKTNAQIELLLAERFPRPDVPTVVRALGAPLASELLAGRPADELALQLTPGQVVPINGSDDQLRVGPLAVRPPVPSIDPNAQGWMEPLSPLAGSRAMLAPLSPGRFALQVTLDQATHDQLRYAQSLLGHALPSGDVGAVLKRALDALVGKLEQQKFAKSARSNPRRSAGHGRYVPTDVRHIVWQRDGGQCTFESESGKRCEARTRLELDHIVPVARGGQTTAANLRLRCRPHNQYAAEQTFGVEFMCGKRKEARRETAKANAQAKARVDANARAEAQARAKADAKAQTQAQAAAAAEAAREKDVIPWLRALGFNAETARRGAANCAHIPDAPLEERVRLALQSLAPNSVRRAAPGASITL